MGLKVHSHDSVTTRPLLICSVWPLGEWRGGGDSPPMVSLVHEKGCWHEWGCLAVRLKIKLFMKTSEVRDRRGWVGRRESRDRAVLEDVGGTRCRRTSYRRGARYRRATASQKARGSAHMSLARTLTLHWHRRPIHLIDRSVASSARECDTAEAGVCPTHTHTRIAGASRQPPPPPPDSHLERGATRSVSKAWGVVAGRTSGGPFT